MSLLSVSIALTPHQNTTPNSAAPRRHLNQDQLCCFASNFVEPIYPRQARLAHTEGVVKLTLVIAADGSTADLQPVSGDPLLLDSTMKAVRQWRFSMGGFVGSPRETEVPLSFTFKIEDPPKPAYLHLTHGKVIRADEIREFTDGIEYAVGSHTHHISARSVVNIDGCARLTVVLQKEGDCIPAGGPSFTVRAIPLLPSETASVAQTRQLPRVCVNEDVQKGKLIHMVFPLYPPITDKRADGTVVLHVILGKNGAVKSARYVSGPTNLLQFAVDAGTAMAI